MGYMSELMDRARHRISVGDYHRMAEAGVFGHQDRVELIEGEVFDMAPIGSQHAYVVNQLARLFTLAAGQDCLVSTQNPILLGDRSEPQPDLALLKPGDYMARLPGPADVLLVVEIASSSIDYDRGVKLELYARHGIPEVWLLDLTGNELLVFRDPDGGTYRSSEAPRAGYPVRPLLLPGIEWRLGEGKTWAVPF
ncbi:Uma2 family endonuclease [Accumulibacter sp.]|uniref:Uma2 family endonuclease n=1 Tax=Accumulibacter sp. TaxID=2053492 RepID=UPI0035B32269